MSLNGMMSSFLRMLLFTAACFPLLSSFGWALDPANNLEQYNCRTWTRQNGLPVNGINAIAQTRDGYLWLGTSSGLVRFDGMDFTLVDFTRVTQLQNTTVRTLATTEDSGLWVGLNDSAFGFFDGRTFSFRGRKEWGGENMNVRTVLPLKDGTLWLAAEKVAARLSSSGKYEPVLSWTPGFDLNVLCCFQDVQGRVFFGTSNKGAYYWQGEQLIKIPDPELVNAACIAQDRDGNLWFGSDRSVRCYDANLNFKVSLPLETEARSLLVDRKGVLWIGTSSRGLARYMDGICTFRGRNEGLAGNYVNALSEDIEGSLWVGTSAGLNQMTDIKFPTILPAEDPAADYAQAVCSSRRGGIWVGSNAGVTYFDGVHKTYSAQHGLPRGSVKRVFEASNGDLYFVSGVRTLSILSEGKVVASYNAPTLVVGIGEDARGVIVSIGGDLFRAGRDGITPYLFAKDKPEFGWILNLAPSKDGSTWVASENGVYRIKDGRLIQAIGRTEFPDPRVQYVHEDSDGYLWAALLNGIVRVKGDKFSYISRRNGLLDDNIYAVVPDDIGNLWVDSSRGIFRTTRESMNDFADGKTHHVDCVAYNNIESVITADKTNNQEHVGCKSLDGRIWFPSAKGVVVIDPSHIPTNQIAPPVHIQRVLVNRKTFDPDQSVAPPGEGELEVYFTAPNFIAPQKTRFRYQLKGYDKNWVEAGERRLAFYANLKPGRYTFRVTAGNADGIWNEVGDSMDIQLLPYFYQAPWFYALAGSMTLIILGGFYQQRAKRLKYKQQALQDARDALEAEVQKRTAELATVNSSLIDEVEGHKRTETELKGKTESLEREIEERKQMQSEIERVHRILVSTSRQAGMAEIATNVLHNVGNVLNSVNVSSSFVLDQVKKSSAGGLAKVVILLREHEQDLGAFINHDPRGKQMLTYLTQLSERLLSEQVLTISELESLRKNVEHIKEIVAMQQNYATVSGLKEIVDLRELVEDSLRMNISALTRHGVELVRDFQEVPRVNIDKHKVLQILVNLVRNAKYACDESGRTDKRVTVRMAREHSSIKIAVIDNGVGIPPENLVRIFNHGFTTRKHGHGFGLHSGALAAREMGGSLSVESEGASKGASFTLELPSQSPGLSLAL